MDEELSQEQEYLINYVMYQSGQEITSEECYKYIKEIKANTYLKKYSKEEQEKILAFAKEITGYEEKIKKGRLTYKTSPRKKIEIASKIGWIVGVVALLIAVIISLGSAEKSQFMVFAYIIGFIACLVGIWGAKAKHSFCPLCGSVGKQISSELIDTSTKIERKVVISDWQKTTAKGHISYDKDGTAYEEQLVTKNTFNKTLRCTNCNNEWEVESKQINK